MFIVIPNHGTRDGTKLDTEVRLKPLTNKELNYSSINTIDTNSKAYNHTH